MAAPHFNSPTASVTSSGALAVAIDEAGLGNGNVTYTVNAQAAITWGCINGGGKNPSAANKRTFASAVTASASFQVKNGRVQATMTAPAPTAPPAADFSCPGGQKIALVATTYSGIVLKDTTNGLTANLADATRVFYS